jgi:Ca2+-binding EF-hand superfamily protein
VITKENIIDAMYKLGHPVTQQELDEIMQEHDIEGDNVISFNEFRSIFFDHKDNEFHNKTECK